MDRIAIAGLSLHDVELAGLERAKARVVGNELGIARELADALGASDVVLLSTCNRLEIVYAREEGHRPTRADLSEVTSVLGLTDSSADDRARMHHAEGRAAARHLFRVVASLDSLVVGEDQILAQVRDAFTRAEAARMCGPLLSSVFRAALQLGKQTRTCTDLSRHPVSVVSLAIQRLVERAGSSRPRVAVLGAGSMGELAARNLAAAGHAPALFVGRTPERAQALAARFEGEAVSLEALRTREPVDALIGATSAPVSLLSAEDLARMGARAPLGAGLFTIDLAVPRDFEPCDDPRVEQIDLESLRELSERNRALRQGAALEAERLIERKLDVLDARFATEGVSEALAEIQRESADVLERELGELRSGRWHGLGPAELHAVERWARAAFGRVSHVPLAALKRFAATRSPESGNDSEVGSAG